MSNGNFIEYFRVLKMSNGIFGSPQIGTRALELRFEAQKVSKWLLTSNFQVLEASGVPKGDQESPEVKFAVHILWCRSRPPARFSKNSIIGCANGYAVAEKKKKGKYRRGEHPYGDAGRH